VSYALRIPGDVAADLRRLDPQLAEEVLDEIDRLATNPAELRTDIRGEAIHDVHRVIAGAAHLVFLHFHRDDQRRVLTLLRLLAEPSG
jgi:hypothetical protein